MNYFKIFIYTIASFVIISILGSYGFFLFGLPKVLTSNKNISKYEKFLSDKIGVPVSIRGLDIKTKPNLEISVNAKLIKSNSVKNENLAKIENIKYQANLLNFKHGKLDADSIFIDLYTLKKYVKTDETQENKPFDITYYPAVNIKTAKILLDEKTFMNIDYIKSNKSFGEIKTVLSAKINSPFTKAPVIIGEDGTIIYSNKLSFDNFSIKANNSKLFLSGDEKNLNIMGKGLPIAELEQSFLYFYHIKHPNKKNFIENFHNMSGTLDVDLILKNGKIKGNCIGHNLKALFSNFKFPIILPKTIFVFNDNKTITAKTVGTFGEEPVTTDFLLTGLFTDDLHIKGNVSSKLTNKFSAKYFKPVQIKGSADAKVQYHTHNGKVDVNYILTVPKESDLISEFGHLGSADKIRQITMQTHKEGNPIKVTSYDYSFFNNGRKEKLLYGDGLFDKNNVHYTPQYFTLKTNGDISINIIKSFLKDYITNGTFDADLRYDFAPKTILGTMNLYNTSHADFLNLKKTNINIDKNKLILKSEGIFYGSPMTAKAVADNNFRHDILVHDIDVHLDSFFVQRGKLTSIPSKFNKAQKPGKRPKKDLLSKIVVEQGRVKVDKIYSRKFDVTNVDIQGSLKNNIANFVIPKAQYAKGLLSAKGIYNLADYSSDIEFFASDIDSNEVATNFFKLKNQVQGDAFATLHVRTKNKLNDIKAKATFAIANGFLPSIGSQEFIINNSKKKSHSKLVNFGHKLIEKYNVKLTLSKIINIDFSKPNQFYSNLYGTFNIDNETVNDVKIFSKSDYLSMFIEGDYNIDDECGNLNLWGRRDKAEAKKIRIFKIPFNLIYRIVFRPEHSKNMYQDKIKLIPDIKTSMASDISLFRIFVSGNLNASDKLKVEMKDLR